MTTLLWPILIILFFLPLPVRADVPAISAIGEYRLGSYDSPADAQRLAFFHAKWRLLDRVAASLAEVPAVKERGFSRDELRAYLPGILQIIEHPLQIELEGSARVASVQASAVVDPADILRRLERLIDDERAKVGLMQAREKIETYRKELEMDTHRLIENADPARVQMLLESRRETMVLIDSEEQVARNWVDLAHRSEAPRTPSPSRKQPDRHTAEPLDSVQSPGPSNAEEHRKRGAALNEQGKYDEAIREFRLALQLVPTLTRAHLGLGAALQSKGELDAAIAEYRRILSVKSDDADAHNNLGTALQRKGELNQAMAEYRAALQVRPDDPLIHFNLGTALSVKGIEDQAAAEYRTAIRLRPDFIQGYLYLALLFQQNGRKKEAADAFRNYLKVAPNTPEQQKWIEEAQRFLVEQDRPDTGHAR